MSGILIIGAGGHAKVVADILFLQGETVLGYVDDNPSSWGTVRLGLPVLGKIDDFEQHSPGGLVMGIGDNAVRRSIVMRLGERAAGMWRSAIHPRATVAASVQLGVGAVILAHAVVNPNSIIGDHVIINTGATVNHDCRIGSFCHVAPGVHLAGGTKLGEGVFVGVGASAIPGRVIGHWAIVGAGAVVINNIPDHVTAIGIPARWDDPQAKRNR